MLSAPEMSRVASWPRLLGEASGDLRRDFRSTWFMADLIGWWRGAPGIVGFATAHGTRCQGVEAFNATLGRPSGWNFLSAKTAAAMKIASSSSCAARNGASDWVGARALRNDSFWNDCTTATKQLRYSASSAVT